MTNRKCLRCGKKITGHPNRKRCKPCAVVLRRQPASTMTAAQIRMAERLIGKMDRRDIAKTVGASLSSLKRAFRGRRLAFHNYCVINPNLVRDVNKYYEAHGKPKTAKKFNLKEKQVEHIIYRYKQHKPRQIRWKNKEIIEAAKMAGLVSAAAQAKYFNRPRANKGSIQSLWMKKFKMGGGSVNGMVHWHARHLLNHKARYIRPKGMSRDGQPIEFRRLVLWVDMEKNLKDEVPHFVREAISAMADFQKWLYGGGDVRQKVLKMIREREL